MTRHFSKSVTARLARRLTRKFADIIRAAGNEYSSEPLINYGQKPISHARNSDIDKVKSLLYSYPELVENR
jgi:hypothetical protein